MGTGTALLIASLIASTAVNYASSKKQASQFKKSAKAQERSNTIQSNRETYEQSADIRRQVRERRIRVAQMMQQSESTGVSGSSGELGGIAGANAKVNSNAGFGFGQNVTNKSLTDQSQIAASAELKAKIIAGKAEVAQTAISGFRTIFG